MLTERDCPVCKGSGEHPTRKDSWGRKTNCWDCRRGKILSPESEEKLNVMEFWLRKRLDDVYQFKSEPNDY